MVWVRRIFLGIAGVFLVFLLFATAIDIAILRVVGSPESVKKLLDSSNIYASAVPSALDEAKKDSGTSSQISFSEPAVRKAAESTFTPQFVQGNTNKVIDSVYGWLDGKTVKPDFKIDLTTAKKTFIEKVAAAAKVRAATLPVCTKTPASFDAFNSPCLPRSTSLAEVASQVRRDLKNGQGFLDTPVLTADTIKGSDSNQSVFADQLKEAPQAYRRFKTSPIILGLLSLLALLFVIFLSSSRRQGWRHTGIIFAVMGLFLILLGLAINEAVSNKVLPQIQLNNAVLQDDVRTLVHDITHSVNGTSILIGGIYALLGLAAILGTIFINRRPVAKVETAVPDEKPPEKDAPKSTPSPKKIKVQ